MCGKVRRAQCRHRRRRYAGRQPPVCERKKNGFPTVKQYTLNSVAVACTKTVACFDSAICSVSCISAAMNSTARMLAAVAIHSKCLYTLIDDYY